MTPLDFMEAAQNFLCLSYYGNICCDADRWTPFETEEYFGMECQSCGATWAVQTREECTTGVGAIEQDEAGKWTISLSAPGL